MTWKEKLLWLWNRILRHFRRNIEISQTDKAIKNLIDVCITDAVLEAKEEIPNRVKDCGDYSKMAEKMLIKVANEFADLLRDKMFKEIDEFMSGEKHSNLDD